MVGPAGVLGLLDLHFADARVEHRDRFGAFAGGVVVVGKDIGVSVLGGVGLWGG